jgi:EAL domain-containing protein (putative c-di-GMP-specific phosphodiesterase class I)
VAEGVETEEEFAAIRRLGCDEVQGHLFGRAMTARVAGALPDRWSRRWPPALREVGD